jgi:hypothetical protein
MSVPTSATLLQNQNDLQPGEHLVDGQTIATLFNWLMSVNGPLTALAGGGAAGAPICSSRITTLNAVGTVGDSVQLPYGVAGMILSVINLTATSANVWVNPGTNPQTGVSDTLINNAGSTVSDVACGAHGNISFYCYEPGAWRSSV